MNKFLLALSVLSLFTLNMVNAQAPQKMSYQLVVRDSVGALITNAAVGFKISIVKDSAAGTVAYSETQNITTNNNGLASLEIGGGTVLTGSFAAISWGNGAYFIKTEIDPLGGTNYSMSGVSQLLSVPYALFAANTSHGTLPTVTTNTATASINSNTTVSVTCNLASNGGEFVLTKGVCYSTTANPTLNNGYETAMIGTGSSSSTGAYTIQINNLNSNTNYHLKAFATTINGTAYGNEITVATNQFIVPTLDSVSVVSITRTTAIAHSNISNDGGATVTARGICYSTNANPTTVDNKIVSGAGTGSFIATMNSLIAGTTYHLRGYATNNIGTAYSNEIVFTTLPLIKPTIITLDTANVTATTATLGGKISDNGGTTIIERGVCYSKTPNPTTSSYKVISTGADSFRVQLDTLNYNTTYYARAYATNAIGTSYGNEVSFKVDTVSVPILITANTSLITPFSANVGGKILNNWGIAIKEKGVCFSKTPNPTIANNKIISTGSDSFLVQLDTLNYNTTYYVRAYAINDLGINYGNEINFKTDTLSIGTLYQGGYVGYILQPNDSGYIAGQTHGLIIAATAFGTLSSPIGWGCADTVLLPGAFGLKLGTGKQNTLDIMAANCPSSAASLCVNYVSNGYHDWFLPSRDELYFILLNKDKLSFLPTNGGYWTSSQDPTLLYAHPHDDNQAIVDWDREIWQVWLGSQSSPANIDLMPKYFQVPVIPVRSF